MRGQGRLVPPPRSQVEERARVEAATQSGDQRGSTGSPEESRGPSGGGHPSLNSCPRGGRSRDGQEAQHVVPLWAPPPPHFQHHVPSLFCSSDLFSCLTEKTVSFPPLRRVWGRELFLCSARCIHSSLLPFYLPHLRSPSLSDLPSLWIIVISGSLQPQGLQYSRCSIKVHSMTGHFLFIYEWRWCWSSLNPSED